MKMKRLAIFFFYDADGKVRDFVSYYVNALHDVADNVCVVVNGLLTDGSRQKLEAVSDSILVRDNTGFDVWAYKEAIEFLGWETIIGYDELIMCNFTCYGPVYPFSEMFDEMAKRNCDFWGAVKHPEQHNYLLPNYQGYIYEHIMSYFIVVRNPMLSSEEFRRYWDNLPQIKSKTESAAYHETVFTKHFEDLGYTSDAYVDLKDYEGRCNNSSIFLADELLMKSRCPLVKRRAFAFPLYSNILSESAGSNASELMDYISANTDYDCEMIWEDLLETQKGSLLCNNMHLNRIISSTTVSKPSNNNYNNICFILYIPDITYWNIARIRLERIPEMCRIILLCSDKAISEQCRLYTKAETREVDITGKSISVACFKACKDDIEQTSYCCCVFGENPPPVTLSQSREDHIGIVLDNLFESENYIANIILRFTNEKRVGMFRSLRNGFSSYFAQPYLFVKGRHALYSSLYYQLKLTVPFDDGTLQSDLEAAFWVRSELLKKIFDVLDDDNTDYVLSQQSALEYMLPMIIQEQGYYTASVTTEKNAMLSLDNHIFMQHYMIEKLKQSGCNSHRFYDVVKFAARAREKATPNKMPGVDWILHQKLGMRHIMTLILRYPANKLDNIKLRINGTSKPRIFARIVSISLSGGRVTFYFLTGNGSSQNCYLSVDGRKFFTVKHLSNGQQMVADYIREYKFGEPLFFELPISELIDQKVKLFNSNGNHLNVNWSANFCFNALELRELGLYVRVCDGDIHIQTKDNFCKSVMKSKSYSIQDKRYFRIAMNRKNHKYTLIAENGGAADNSYQLFKCAVSQGEDVIYVASEAMINNEKDPKLKKRMVVYNSKQHIDATLDSKRWIGSFSLRREIVPTELHDIHYAMLPAEWIFIPHGMAIGDKSVAMLHRYSWDNPSRTFASVPMERDAYINMYDFKNVTSLGAPRMDKWADAIVDENKIMIFFTWRISLSSSNRYNADTFKNTDYFKIAVEVVRDIRAIFPDKKLFYVFHHEISKNKLDIILREELAEDNITFIDFQQPGGPDEFNEAFRDAKYLITDFSSAAFDFAYKKNSIPVYYLSEKFIAGHYQLMDRFFDVHLGIITRNSEELIDALKMEKPTEEMQRRKDIFFPYQDNKNCERVFNEIFRKPAPESFLPVVKPKYPTANVKRLGIYFFYDEDGIVDEYVIYYLKALREVCSEICVVVNGNLTEESKQIVRPVCDKLIIRENRGFDSWAYKEAIESYGYEYIGNNYDELVLNNFTNFGPVFPFREMFDEMSKHDCDFWGHNRYIEDGNKINGCPVIDHLQSYFSVFRKKILVSEDFRRYWSTLDLPKTYKDAITCHEIRYTRYFESMGYISDAFMPWKKYRYGFNSPVFYAYRQMVEDRSPLLKRKVFFNKEDRFEFPQRDSYTVYDVVNYIRTQTEYPMDLIADNMERTMTFPKEVNTPYNDDERAAAELCTKIKEKQEHFRKANMRFDPEKLYGRKYFSRDKADKNE